MLKTSGNRSKPAKHKVGFRKIVVATDFSEASRNALKEACLLLKGDAKARLAVIHVADRQLWQFAPPSTQETIREQVWDAGAKSMEELKAKLPKRVKTVLCEGDIPEEITKFARKWKPSLLIIGTHGRQGLQQLMVGSIAQEILRSVECPVMTIGPAMTLEKKNSGPVVLATDFSRAANKAARFAIRFANKVTSSLVVFRAFDPSLAKHEARLLKRLQTRFSRNPGLKGLHVEYRVGFGELSAALIESSIHSGARYLVMGAKRGGAFARIATHWPKAMTYRVICGATAPVITVRS